jgi:toxin ParE1/3/4
VRLGGEAERDFAAILRWTAATFGRTQAEVYSETLKAAICDLQQGPDILGSRAREDIAASIRILHVARCGRRGSHLLVFRVSGEKRIDVLRILHESMDHGRHAPKTPGRRDE